VAWCVTTLRTRRHAQFIECLSGGLQFWIGTLAVGRGTESLARWFVAFTVADPPATSQDYGAVYGDSPRRGKVSRHVAWPDNGERRWCQRDWPHRWEKWPEFIYSSIFLTEERSLCSAWRESGRWRGSGARSPAARGGESAISFSHCTMESLFSVPDSPTCRA
jgi:hypothetical protein